MLSNYENRLRKISCLRQRLVTISRYSSLALLACLPFLLFYDTSRNIDMQGLILLVAGALAWLAILLEYRLYFKRWNRINLILLGIFCGFSLLSSFLNPHISESLIGSPLLRLGGLGLLACVGSGLLLSNFDAKKIIIWTYLLILAVGIFSIPFSLINFHTLIRAGGVFAQADVLGVMFGCGLILGAWILREYSERNKLLIASQTVLLALLILTETRSVILILTILMPLVYYSIFRSWNIAFLGAYLLILVFGYLALTTYLPSRLTDRGYAHDSIVYRYDLAKSAVKASAKQPLIGYGPGNIAEGLKCSGLKYRELRQTCAEGYYFNSSHNIFLDRVLGIGWLGGLAYLAIIILALRNGLASSKEIRVMAFCLVLIVAYYLTNVTSLALELLLWVLLFQCLKPGTIKV